MKLAEFFVSLGFDMTGDKQLDQLENKLGEVASNAAKALAGFASMTAGMAVMLHQAMETANGFRQFKAVTGQSAEELQKWQYIAGQAGISGEEIVGTIKSIQRQSAEIAMGRGNPTPWAVLGLDPSSNPFDTIKRLREAVQGFSPAIARSMVESLGVGEGVFAMLEMTEQKFQQLQKDFILSDQQTKSINAISSAWSEVLFQINAVKNQLVASLAPALKPVLDVMKIFLAKAAEFAQWLGKGSTGAKAMRGVLITLAAAIVAITGGLTSLLAILGAITAAIALFQVVSSPVVITIAAITAAVVLLVLMIEDFYTWLKGGDSIFGDFVDSITPLRDILKEISDLFAGFSHWKLGKDISMMEADEKAGNLSDSRKAMLAQMRKEYAAQGIALQYGTGKLPSMAEMLASGPGSKLQGMAIPSMAGFAGASKDTNIGTVNIDVKSPVDDPYKLGRAVADQLKDLENITRQQARPLTR
jgi:hypothetical protein